MAVLVVLAVLFGVPALEIWVFVAVGERIGALETVLLTLLTAAIAVPLLRAQGRAALESAQTSLARGETPVRETLDGVGMLLGAVLLLIPGFVTDAIGLLLFVPPLRRVLMALLLGRLMRSGSTRVWTAGRGWSGPGDRTGGGPGTIDGEFRDVTPDAPRITPPEETREPRA